MGQHDESKHPRGKPGNPGQFRTVPKGDPGAVIDPDQVDIVDHPLVVAALGDGPELDADDKETLRILLDPANHPDENSTVTEMLERLDRIELDASEGEQPFANLLARHYEAATGRPNAFVYETSDDEWYTISTSVPGFDGFHLHVTGSLSNLFNWESNDLRSVIAATSMMRAEYDSLQTVMAKMRGEQ